MSYICAGGLHCDRHGDYYPQRICRRCVEVVQQERAELAEKFSILSELHDRQVKRANKLAAQVDRLNTKRHETIEHNGELLAENQKLAAALEKCKLFIEQHHYNFQTTEAWHAADAALGEEGT